MSRRSPRTIDTPSARKLPTQGLGTRPCVRSAGRGRVDGRIASRHRSHLPVHPVSQQPPRRAPEDHLDSGLDPRVRGEALSHAADDRVHRGGWSPRRAGAGAYPRADVGPGVPGAVDRRALAPAARRLLDRQSMPPAHARRRARRRRCDVRRVGAGTQTQVRQSGRMAQGTARPGAAIARRRRGRGGIVGGAARRQPPRALPLPHRRQCAEGAARGARGGARLAGGGRRAFRRLARGDPPGPARLGQLALVLCDGAHRRAADRRPARRQRLAAVAMLPAGAAATRDLRAVAPRAGGAVAGVGDAGRNSIRSDDRLAAGACRARARTRRSACAGCRRVCAQHRGGRSPFRGPAARHRAAAERARRPWQPRCRRRSLRPAPGRSAGAHRRGRPPPGARRRAQPFARAGDRTGTASPPARRRGAMPGLPRPQGAVARCAIRVGALGGAAQHRRPGAGARSDGRRGRIPDHVCPGVQLRGIPAQHACPARAGARHVHLAAAPRRRRRAGAATADQER